MKSLQQYLIENMGASTFPSDPGTGVGASDAGTINPNYKFGNIIFPNIKKKDQWNSVTDNVDLSLIQELGAQRSEPLPFKFDPNTNGTRQIGYDFEVNGTKMRAQFDMSESEHEGIIWALKFGALLPNNQIDATPILNFKKPLTILATINAIIHDAIKRYPKILSTFAFIAADTREKSKAYGQRNRMYINYFRNANPKWTMLHHKNDYGHEVYIVFTD